MKALVLRSSKAGAAKAGGYLQKFDVLYAGRVLGNLRNPADFCRVCESECVECRRGYGRNLGPAIAGVLEFPNVLPYVLEKPEEYVPARVPPHDVMLAIHVHEQILLEMLKRHEQWGTKGVVVPLEAPGWIGGAARRAARELCERAGIQIAFPKPFCAFNPPAGGILSEFRNTFHIGRPDASVTVKNGLVHEVRVHVSAACGATYYIARWLQGRSVSDNLRHDVISRRFHCYPCTASMEMDDRLDDTPLHAADLAHQRMLDAVSPETPPAPAAPARTTLGAALPQPAPRFDSEANIEKAKAAVMEALSQRPCVHMDEIRSMRGISPAAAHSAILLLKKEKKIVTAGSALEIRLCRSGEKCDD